MGYRFLNACTILLALWLKTQLIPRGADVFWGFMVLHCTRKNNLAKNWCQIVKIFAKNFEPKKYLGWNHHIVDENRIIDMWYVLM